MADAASFRALAKTAKVLNEAECLCGGNNDNGLNCVPQILEPANAPFPNQAFYSARNILWKKVVASFVKFKIYKNMWVGILHVRLTSKCCKCIRWTDS